MMKRLKNVLFSAMLMLLAACMLFTGCGEKTTPPDNGDGTQNEGGGNNDDGNQNTEGAENGGETDVNQGLESGFDFSGGGAPNRIYMGGYKSDRTVFDIDDVTLEYYFGGSYSSGVEFTLEHGSNYPGFDLYFTNDEEDSVHIRREEENFVSEEYSCDIVYDEGYKHVLEVNYNHSEILTIPKELFTKEKGTVLFEIYSVHARDPFKKVTRLLHIPVYYKVDGDKVLLSSQHFE